jgi:hypothetical protein
VHSLCGKSHTAACALLFASVSFSMLHVMICFLCVSILSILASSSNRSAPICLSCVVVHPTPAAGAAQKQTRGNRAEVIL